MASYIGGSLLNRTQSRARRLGKPVRQRYTRGQARRLKTRLHRQGTVNHKPYSPRADQLKQGPAPTSAPKPGLGPQGPAPTKPAVGQHATPDSAYYNAIDTTKRKEQASLSGLDEAQQGIEHDYGFTDPTNPFSRVNSMKQAFLARRKAASVSLSSEGKLYSGTHERAIARTRREEEASRAELRGAYEAAIRQIGSEKAGVKFASEEERNQAFEDYLARAPEADVDLGAEQPKVAAPTPKPSAAPANPNMPSATNIQGSAGQLTPTGAPATPQAREFGRAGQNLDDALRGRTGGGKKHYVHGGVLKRSQSRARRLGREPHKRYTRAQARRLKALLAKRRG